MKPGPAPPALASLSLLIVITFLALSPPAQGQGTITITIHDYHDRALPDAEVTLATGNSTATKNTDSSGQVTFDTLDENLNYTLTVKYLGVIVAELTDWNYSNPNSPKTIKVEVFDLNLKVYSHEKEDVVPSAKVKVTSSETSPATDSEKTTDSNGEVTFQRLPGKGTAYSILINYTAYGASATSSPVITLSEANYQSLYEYEIPLYRLKITTTDRDSEEVPDVQLRVWRTSKEGSPIQTGSTGSDGSLTLSLLPAGTYVVEATYRGDIVESSEEITVSGNLERTIQLPLKQMVVTVNDLNGDPVSGYSLLGRLLVGGSVYAEVRGSTGELDFGRVYDARGYDLIILFEGQEVYSEEIGAGEVGSKAVNARFGDFSVALESSGLFGQLPSLLPRAEIKLLVGDFAVTAPLTEGFALFRRHPLVQYSYEVLLDSDIIGSGSIPAPAHQSVVEVKLTTKTLMVFVSSQQGEPIDGTLEVSVDTQLIGSASIGINGTSIDGLLPIEYGYRFIYKGVEVAVGSIGKSTLGGSLNISARVSDISITALDFEGENPLAGAAITLSVEEYREKRVADRNGTAVFDKVPITTVGVNIVYRGVKVYASPAVLTTGQQSITITGTGVYKVGFKVLDGEKRPLVGGRLKASVGELLIDREINKSGTLWIDMIPNGSLTVSVSYLDVKVAEGIHRVTRNRMEIEIETRVYTIKATVLMHTNTGLQPLSNADVVFKIDGKTKYEGVTEEGVVSGKLPAADYDILVTYQGVPVGISRVTHKSFTDVRLAVKVYQATLRLLDVDEKPLSNATLTIRHGERDVGLLTTDEEGVAITYLPEGEYVVEFMRDGKNYTIPIRVEDLFERSIIHIPEPSSNFAASVAVAAGLFSISIYGLVRSIKPGIDKAPRGEEERRRRERWSRRQRRNV